MIKRKMKLLFVMTLLLTFLFSLVLPVLTKAKAASETSKSPPYYGSYKILEDNPFFQKIAWPYPESGQVGAVQGSVKLGEDVWNHGGWDIGGEEHKPVYAIADGEVTFYGMLDEVYAVVIRHKAASGDGYVYSFYLNLCGTHNTIQVRNKEKVKAGSLIGFLGMPERDGEIGDHAHLHFELRWSEDDTKAVPSEEYTVDLFATELYLLRPENGRASISAIRKEYKDFVTADGKKIPAVFQFDSRLFLYAEKEIFGIKWEKIEFLLALDVIFGYEAWSYILSNQSYKIWFPYYEISPDEVAKYGNIPSLNQMWDNMINVNQSFETGLKGLVPTEYLEWELPDQDPEEGSEGENPADEDLSDFDPDLAQKERVILVGDSRISLMKDTVETSVPTEFLGKSREGYEWLYRQGVSEVNKIRKPGDKIVIWIGTNDYWNSFNEYVKLFSKLSKEAWKDNKVYVVEVGFINMNMEMKYYGYQKRSNVAINNFNNKLRLSLSKKISWIKINHLLEISKSGTWGNRKDGIHYSPETSQKIYNQIIGSIFSK